VKELVENSLDAGAASIEIEVEGGGATLVRVRDDGAGIAATNWRSRWHAMPPARSAASTTSRRSATLGFRGEALPSIASVSRVKMVSRPQECARRAGRDGG